MFREADMTIQKKDNWNRKRITETEKGYLEQKKSNWNRKRIAGTE